LEKRIDEYYVSWQTHDLEKMWTLLSSREKAGSKKEFIEAWKKVDLRPASYSVIDIEIENGKARVKVKLTMAEHGEEFTGTCFDYWQIESGKWVLVDSGREE
jgi:hypothetical protein